MKKLVVFFLVLASVFSFFLAYNQTDKEELEKLEKVEEVIAKQFVIPSNSILADPDEFYPLLFETAKKYKVNIFRKNINYNEDEKVIIQKYVLLTGRTVFFNNFRIKSGRILSESNTQNGKEFISTVNTGDKNQIGVVRDFGDNDLITIKPLKISYEYLPVEGQYFVEVPNEKAFNVFIKGFTNKLNMYYAKYGKISFSPSDFKNNYNDTSENGNSLMPSMRMLKYINYLIFTIVFILLVYYIFNEAKRIGIIKMHGVSNIRLWWLITGRLITIIFVFSVIISMLVTVLVKNATYSFVFSNFVYQFKTFIIMTTISLIVYIYISKINVSLIIKNRKDTKGIFVLNILLKFGCSILLLMFCLSIYNQYVKIIHKQENLKNWDRAKDYGIFYPLNIGNDRNDVRNGSPVFFSTVNGELYNVLNKMGAVLMNARMYEETALRLDKGYNGLRTVTVNNNYLREFRVYDVHNKSVNVSETSTDWILLVPEKYRSKEKEILSFFKKGRESSIDYEKRVFSRKIPDNIRNQPIKIIWLANDQKIFSFNQDVFPAENNNITDPIIQVVTEKNSLLADRSSILGNGCTDPLKIRLINRDPALTNQILKPELVMLKLDDNLKHLVSADQFFLQQIYDLQKQMKLLVLIGLGLIAGLLILVTQNLAIFFSKNQRKFIVRRLFGTGFFRTYKEYILLFSVTWAIQILVSAILNKELDIKLFAMAALLMLVELAASVITFMLIEQRNKLKVLKGG